MLEHFHFIRPLWLLALAPLALLAWAAFRANAGSNAWRRIVDASLLPLMMVEGARGANRSAVWLASIGWLVATVALADPTWERKPQPVFQTNAARVVVLDLSSTMNDADVKPSRLARARYKVEDVLAQAAEGQTALVAYAGDAFTVAPLTRDANTIRSLLKVLEPDLMPVDGSRADLGLLKAGELLRQAGVTNGRVLLIADSVGAGKSADAERAAARLKSEGHTVSVLGVGTQDAVPLTDEKGRLVRTESGGVQVPRLDAQTLASVARAGGGRYQLMTDAGQGLQSLLDAGATRAQVNNGQTKAVAPAWKERGPFIAVVLLPLAALAFRRNWLLNAALLAALAAPSQAATAATWADAWQRPDQQASKALAAGDYAKAAAVAPDAARRGSAEYKRGNYELALAEFSRAAGSDADYNRGNALARLGRYQEAVAAYDKAIGESPSNDDAKANKAAVEALLKKEPPRPPPGQQQHKPSDGSQQDAKANGQNQGGGQGSGQGRPARNRRPGPTPARRRRTHQAPPGRIARPRRRTADLRARHRSKARRFNPMHRAAQVVPAHDLRPERPPRSHRATISQRPPGNSGSKPVARQPGLTSDFRSSQVPARPAQAAPKAMLRPRPRRPTAPSRSKARRSWRRSNGCGASRTTRAAFCGESSSISTASAPGRRVPVTSNARCERCREMTR